MPKNDSGASTDSLGIARQDAPADAGEVVAAPAVPAPTAPTPAPTPSASDATAPQATSADVAAPAEDAAAAEPGHHVATYAAAQVAAMQPALAPAVNIRYARPGAEGTGHVIVFNAETAQEAHEAAGLLLQYDAAHTWQYVGSGPDEANGRREVYLLADA